MRTSTVVELQGLNIIPIVNHSVDDLMHFNRMSQDWTTTRLQLKTPGFERN